MQTNFGRLVATIGNQPCAPAGTVTFCDVPWTLKLTGASQPLIAAVTVGGTAVSPFNSVSPNRMPSGGAVIKNPTAATEALFVDIVNVAQTAEPGTNGTTVSLAAGQSFVVPPNFTGTVSVNAVTSAHAFVAYGVGIT